MTGTAIMEKIRSMLPTRPRRGTELAKSINVGTYRLRRGRFLGEGASGVCYEYTDLNTNEKYCLKAISKRKMQEKDRVALKKEILIQSSLEHESIVRLFLHFTDDKYHYLLMELVDGCNMKDVLKFRGRLSEPEVRYYILQIVDALDYIHKKRYIHRDLKLANIYLTDKCRIKLGDFGLSAEILEDKKDRRTMCGTPNYIAPEMLMRKGYGAEVDLWAVGVLAFVTLFGETPFNATDTNVLFSLIIESNYKFPDCKDVSQDGRDFIKSLLQVEPEARPNILKLRIHNFLDQNYIVKSLNPIALITDPGEVEKGSETPNKRKKAVSNLSGLTKFKNLSATAPNYSQMTKVTEKRVDISPEMSPEQIVVLPKSFHQQVDINPVSDSLKVSIDSISEKLKALIEKPSTILNTDSQFDSPEFVVKQAEDPQGLGTSVQMSNGNVAILYKSMLTLVTKPNTSTLLAYRKVYRSSTKLNGLHYETQSFNKQNQRDFMTFLRCSEQLAKINDAYEPALELEQLGLNKQDITSTCFPLQYTKNGKDDMYVLSNGIVQMHFASGLDIVLDSSTNRITFVENKSVHTFDLQTFLIASLLSEADFRSSYLDKSIGFSLDSAKLPKPDMKQFESLPLKSWAQKTMIFFDKMVDSLKLSIAERAADDYVARSGYKGRSISF